VGDNAAARLRPAGLTGNGTNTKFSVFFRTFAAGYSISGLPTSTFKNASGKGVGGGAGFDFSAKLRVTSISPATITDTTNFITMTGQVQSPDGTTGCTLTFRGAFTRTP
jgi:hypothetical protein